MSNPDAFAERVSAALAAELRAERAARNLSYAELSEGTGISARTLTRQMNGSVAIDTTDLFRLCEALGLDPRDLMSRAVKRAGQ